MFDMMMHLRADKGSQAGSRLRCSGDHAGRALQAPPDAPPPRRARGRDAELQGQDQHLDRTRHLRGVAGGGPRRPRVSGGAPPVDRGDVPKAARSSAAGTGARVCAVLRPVLSRSGALGSGAGGLRAALRDADLSAGVAGGWRRVMNTASPPFLSPRPWGCRTGAIVTSGCSFLKAFDEHGQDREHGQ